MKKVLYSVGLLMAALTAANGQMKVGANPTSIDPSAMIQIDAAGTRAGALLPRVTLSQTTVAAPAASHVAGLLVYNTATAGDVTPGYYYNDGTRWMKVSSLMDVDVKLVPGTEVTEPVSDVKYTVANHVSKDAAGSNGTVLYGSDNIAIGASAMAAAASPQEAEYRFANIALGANALNQNKSFQNIAIGNSALKNSASPAAYSNIAIGYQAMENFVTDFEGQNVFVGNQSGRNVSGAANVGLGHEVMVKENPGGSFNTGAGFRSLISVVGNNNTAYGSATLLRVNGNDNLAMGVNAGSVLATGNYNLFLGTNAGLSYSADVASVGSTPGTTTSNDVFNVENGNYNIMIGVGARGSYRNASDQLNIGNWIFGYQGRIGIGVRRPAVRLHVVKDSRDLSPAVIQGCPVYADNAAATAAGLTAGMLYRTATGILMVTY